MRKEVVLAVLGGILIGVFVAFGIWRVARYTKKAPSLIFKNETPIPKNIDSINLIGLEDFTVIDQTFSLKGITKPSSDLIISTKDEDYYLKSGTEGEFEKEITLKTEGLNEINIFNLTYNFSENLSLVNIQDELGLASYVGTITDISIGTIQVKGENEAIFQISTSEETEFVNSLKKNIAVKETDLAIGDFVIALGTVNGNKVLKSSRVLVVSPSYRNNIEGRKITIETLSKTKINDITLPKTWVGPNIKDLAVGQEIIVVGTKNEEKFDLRSIFEM